MCIGRWVTNETYNIYLIYKHDQLSESMPTIFSFDSCYQTIVFKQTDDDAISRNDMGSQLFTETGTYQVITQGVWQHQDSPKTRHCKIWGGNALSQVAVLSLSNP